MPRKPSTQIEETITKQIDDALAKSLEPLKNQLSDLADKLEPESKDQPPQEENKLIVWLRRTGELLAIPSVIILIILQIGQVGQLGPNTEKTIAETQKTYTEELKTRAELQILLGQLETEKNLGEEAYQEQFKELLPRLQETITKLNEIDTNTRPLATDTLYKGLLLLIFVQGIGFLTNVLALIMNWLLSTLFIVTTSFSSYRREKRPILETENKSATRFQSKRKSMKIRSNRRSSMNRYITATYPTLAQIPAIVILFIQIFVFISLIVPYFDLVSSYIGVNLEFTAVLDKLLKLDISGAVRLMQDALFR